MSTISGELTIGKKKKKNNKIDKKSLGKAIDAALSIDGRTAKEVSESLKIDSSVFCRYLNGKTVPEIASYHRLRAWALTKGIDLDKAAGLN